MKVSVFFLLLLLNYGSSEHLLGGWSVSNDESLKSECLHKALTDLIGSQINNEIRSEASDVICRTQIVNGLNIKCTFTFRGKHYRCLYYKSFIQTLETQVEECKVIDDKPVVQSSDTENANNNKEQLLIDDKGNNEQEQPVHEQKQEEEEEQQQQQQPEEEPAENNDNNRDDEDDQEAQVASKLEEGDDEAAIDALNNKMSDQAADTMNEQQK